MNFSGREDLRRRCASKNRTNITFFYDEGASTRLERFADHTSFDSVSLDKRDQNTHFGAIFRRFRAEHCVPSFAVSLFCARRVYGMYFVPEGQHDRSLVTKCLGRRHPKRAVP